MTREQQLRVLYRFGLPGMTLCGRPPLLKRCDCGRPISANKARCHFCQQLIYRELAEQIGDDRKLFNAMLDRNFSEPESRRTMVQNLKPYLKFDPLKEPHNTNETDL